MAIDSETARKRLYDLAAGIREQSRLAAGARETVSLDQQSVGRLSRMDAMQAQSMAQAQERKRQNELVRIEMALRRIDEGEYGYCADCGEPIAEKRLDVDPVAERCVNCA